MAMDKRIKIAASSVVMTHKDIDASVSLDFARGVSIDVGSDFIAVKELEALIVLLSAVSIEFDKMGDE